MKKRFYNLIVEEATPEELSKTLDAELIGLQNDGNEIQSVQIIADTRTLLASINYTYKDK